MVALLLAFAAAPPAAAQSILRDSETELLFRDISRPLIQAAGLDPANVKVVLLNDPEINAFVAGGQIVYIHSGLLTEADNVNQLQGVIAHELGHVAGGHILRMGEGAGAATKISILSLVLAAAAIAAGAPPDAGMGIMMAGQRAAIGNFMAFTRAQESSADLAGASYLSKSGISGKGSLEFFKKLQNQEYRLAVYSRDSYDRTHPLSQERIRRSRKSTKRTRPGIARSTRRSRRASSGSRPSFRAISTRRSRRGNIRKPTRRSRRITPARMPITSALIPTKR
jgi:predicted Zn-dependent protease